MRLVLLTLAALLIAGCSTTPRSDYYVLTATTSDGVSPSGISLGVGPVSLSPWLDRSNITLKQGNALVVHEFSRWGEPLVDGITRVMVENLSYRLGSNGVIAFPWRADEIPGYRIKLKVLDLNRSDGQAHLLAQWSLERPDKSTSVERQLSRLSIAVEDDSFASLAAAYSALLAELAEQVAGQLEAQLTQSNFQSHGAGSRL